MKKHLLVSLALLLNLGVQAGSPTPIPAADFANAQGLLDPRLSPDGKRYAGMVRTDARRALVSRKADGSETRIAFALDKPDFELDLLRWLGNERLLLRLTNYKPGLVYGRRLPVSRLLAINLDGSNAVVLYDNDREGWTNHASTEVDQACPLPDQVLLVRGSGDQRFSVDRVNAGDGIAREASPALNDVDSRWWADAQGRVRVALRVDDKGKRELLLRQPDAAERLGRWQPWTAVDAIVQAETFKVLGFDADPQRLIVQTTAPDGTGLVQRWALDGQAEPETLLRLKEQSRLGRLLRNEADCRAVGVRSDAGLLAWGDQLEGLVGGIRAALPGQHIQLRQWQGERYLISASAFDRPNDNLLGERKAGQLGSVEAGYAKLPEQLPIQRESLTGGGELYRPAGATAAPKALLVCLECELHADEQRPGFQPLRALLVDRGYALLSPKLSDYDWQKALPQWTEKLVPELEAQVQQALRSTGLDAQRVGLIAGEGLNAYLGLRWAQQRETPLRAIVARGALTNLQRYRRLAREEETSAGTRAWIRKLLGDLDSTALDANSPSAQAQRLRAPSLLLHGDHDGRVAIEHAIDLRRGLEKAGTPVQLISFANSDSHLDHPPYRRQAAEAIEAWLAKYL